MVSLSASWSGETHWPPISSIAPSITSVHRRPPTRSRASSTTTDRPAFFSSLAAVVPAAPAPMMTTSRVSSVIRTPLSVLVRSLSLSRGRDDGVGASTGSATGLWVDAATAVLQRPRHPGSVVGQRGRDDVQALVEQVVGDRQRRQETDHVPVGAAREHDDALCDGRLRDRGG